MEVKNKLVTGKKKTLGLKRKRQTKDMEQIDRDIERLTREVDQLWAEVIAACPSIEQNSCHDC